MAAREAESTLAGMAGDVVHVLCWLLPPELHPLHPLTPRLWCRLRHDARHEHEYGHGKLWADGPHDGQLRHGPRLRRPHDGHDAHGQLWHAHGRRRLPQHALWCVTQLAADVWRLLKRGQSGTKLALLTLPVVCLSDEASVKEGRQSRARAAMQSETHHRHAKMPILAG